MNSSKIRFAALIAFVYCFIDLGCRAVTVSTGVKERVRAGSEGIFGRMLDEVTEPERLEKERHKASLRKKQQLAEAEREYEETVQQDERQAEAQRRAASEQQQVQQPQARVLTATNEESQINIGELEANIQANLQAKLDAGASKADLLASVGQEEMEQPSPQTQTLTQNGPYQQRSPQGSMISDQEVHVAAPSAAQAGSQETSKEKVRQIAKKLDIPFTADLLALGSNAAISDALIEQAMAAGKTDAEINEAMETL